MRIIQTFYGWLEAGVYRISRRPHDAPIRPVFAESMDRIELEQFAFKRRGRILWWPPLPRERASAGKRA